MERVVANSHKTNTGVGLRGSGNLIRPSEPATMAIGRGSVRHHLKCECAIAECSKPLPKPLQTTLLYSTRITCKSVQKAINEPTTAPKNLRRNQSRSVLLRE